MTTLQILIKKLCEKTLERKGKTDKSINNNSPNYFFGFEVGFNEGFRACQKWVRKLIREEDDEYYFNEKLKPK